MVVHITYFVHGSTEENEQGRYTGWHDIGLSDLGREQSRTLREHVKDKRYGAIITSDLRRAMESAQITWGDSGIPMRKRWELRECDLGLSDGLLVAVLDPLMIEHIDTPWPGGRSYREVEERMRRLLAFVKQEYKGGRVAFVAHRAPQLALDVIITGKTWEEAIRDDWRHTRAWQPGWEYVLH